MIRLPWVSRARLELLEHNSRELIGQLRTALAVAEARTAAAEAREQTWSDRYHLLKVAGPVEVQKPVDKPVDPAPRQAVEADPLKALIHAKAGDDSRKRGMMLRQLAVDRATGMNEDDIRSAIENGVSSDGVPI